MANLFLTCLLYTSLADLTRTHLDDNRGMFFLGGADHRAGHFHIDAVDCHHRVIMLVRVLQNILCLLYTSKRCRWRSGYSG